MFLLCNILQEHNGVLLLREDKIACLPIKETSFCLANKECFYISNNSKGNGTQMDQIVVKKMEKTKINAVEGCAGVLFKQIGVKREAFCLHDSC